MFADDGLSFYTSAEAFAGYAEPPDVLDGVYTAAFDGKGRRLRISAPQVWLTPEPTSGRDRRSWQRDLRRNYFAVIEIDADHPADPARAAQVIREALQERYPDKPLARMSLVELMTVEEPVV